MKNSLIADTISNSLLMAIYKDGKQIASLRRDGMALENFFGLINELCNEANMELSEIDNFIFCEGMGSVLGIRCASVSFFTIAFLNKSKVFSYNLFDIAKFLTKKENNYPYLIICDSKKNHYNVLNVESENTYDEKEITYEDFSKLSAKKIYYIKQRESQILRENFVELRYNIEDIYSAITEDSSILKEQEEVKDALVLTKREFVKWNLKAHI